MDESAPRCTDAVGNDFTGVATDRRFTRLQPLIAEATAAGAEASVAKALHGARARRPRKLPLTVLTACSNNVQVMQQDLFGPVLRLFGAKSLDAAIAYGHLQ